MRPRNKEKTTLALLTVAGKDKPGIIAKVTGFLFRHGCNLEDISMTVLEGELAMFLMVRLPFHHARDIQNKLLEFETRWGLTFFWKGLNALRPTKPRQRPHNKFIVSAIGLDKTGIVHHLSRLLAHFNLNITDLNSKILSDAQKPVYALVLEVDIPRDFPIPQLERAFTGLQRKLHLDISLKPVENVEF